MFATVCAGNGPGGVLTVKGSCVLCVTNPVLLAMTTPLM
jgi:hypothetical protein